MLTVDPSPAVAEVTVAPPDGASKVAEQTSNPERQLRAEGARPLKIEKKAVSQGVVAPIALEQTWMVSVVPLVQLTVKAVSRKEVLDIL